MLKFLEKVASASKPAATRSPVKESAAAAPKKTAAKKTAAAKTVSTVKASRSPSPAPRRGKLLECMSICFTYTLATKAKTASPVKTEPVVAIEPEVSPKKKTIKADKKTATSASASVAKPKKEKPTIVRGYLVIYNAVSAVAWAYLLFNLCRSYLVDEPQNYRILFPKTGKYLAYLQSAAVLEIIHAALGWVPSSVISNVIQIASRLFIIWVCAIHFNQGKHWGYALLSFAWSISDLTRYCYYLTQLLGVSAPLLKWARYNFFLVLYPVGTIGEVMLLFWARQRTISQPHIYWPLLGVLSIYAPG